MNFEDYNKSTIKRKKEYLEFSNAEKNISESKKNLAEAADLVKPFYRKPSFYITLAAALLPTLLGVIAFYGTNAREFFDNKVKEVKLEKRELKLQIDSLNVVRQKMIEDSLFLSEEYRKKVKIRLLSLREEKENDSIEKFKLKKSNDRLNLQIQKLNFTNSKSNNELKDDLKEALEIIKDRNETIFKLKSNLFDARETYSKWDEEFQNSKLNFTLKNIIIYIILNGENKVRFTEIIKNISFPSNISNFEKKVNFLRYKLNDYSESDIKVFDIYFDNELNDYFISINKNADLKSLLNIYYNEY